MPLTLNKSIAPTAVAYFLLVFIQLHGTSNKAPIWVGGLCWKCSFDWDCYNNNKTQTNPQKEQK